MKSLEIDTGQAQISHYMSLVKQRGDERRDHIQRLLQLRHDDWCPRDSKIAIFTTGSDGRYENKTFTGGDDSNIELICFAEGGYDTHQTLIRGIRNSIPYKIDDMEFKNDADSSITCYKGDKARFFPTRIWDSILFYNGLSGDIHDRLSKRVSLEIISYGASLIDRFSDRVRLQRKVMNSGQDRFKGNVFRVFDTEAGMVFHNPTNYQYGFKTGPLRYIQYLLAFALMRAIKLAGKHLPFIDFLPTNILDRLDFLLENKLTTYSAGEIENLKYIYGVFLMLYHKMQEFHHKSGNTDFIIEDRNTLADIASMIEFLDKTLTPNAFFKT